MIYKWLPFRRIQTHPSLSIKIKFRTQYSPVLRHSLTTNSSVDNMQYKAAGITIKQNSSCLLGNHKPGDYICTEWLLNMLIADGQLSRYKRIQVESWWICIAILSADKRIAYTLPKRETEKIKCQMICMCKKAPVNTSYSNVNLAPVLT